MSSVGNISNNYGTRYSGTVSMQRRQRPDASEMAETLFSQLDSAGKGYIQESDMESAISGLSSSSSSSSSTGGVSASEIFGQLDNDSDGKITQDELASSLKKLAESLDEQFGQSRMAGAMLPPPPPPSGEDSGLSKEELTSQLSEIGDSDSSRSTLISSILENFDVADTNSDGKVSNTEAMAYAEAGNMAGPAGASETSSSGSTSGSETNVSDAKIFRQLMELMRTYGTSQDSSFLATLNSTLSTSA